MADFEMILRLILAVGAGAIVGSEREFHGRPAGLRTHILVALGAAIMSLASLELAEIVQVFGASPNVRVDISRIASGMITGIGFLGAGTILKMGKSVRGLTTAASLWCVAGVGMGFGFGFYRLSIFGSMLMLFTLLVVTKLEQGISKDWYKNVIVRLKGSRDQAEMLSKKFQARGWVVLDLDWRKSKTKDTFVVDYKLRFNGKDDIQEAVRMLDETDFAENYQIQ
ncbi:MAG: MgtC/SapB family protein [Phycisphaerae bacterium]